MARARNIKPGFFLNDELAECSRDARLLFIGLWTIADREGRLVDKPKRIKLEVFPYDNDVDCELLLSQLESKGFIVRYVVGGDRFIEIPKFKKHQTPHFKEKQSEIPANTLSPGQALDKPSASTNPKPDEPPLNPESGYLNPESGYLNEDNGSLVEACDKPGASLGQAPDSRKTPLSLSKHGRSVEFVESWTAWKMKQQASDPAKRMMCEWTERQQLKSLEHFETAEAIQVVDYSASRTKCANLITNGDHKTRASPKTISPGVNYTPNAKLLNANHGVM